MKNFKENKLGFKTTVKLFLVASALTAACGCNGSSSFAQQSCTVSGNIISCPDGSSVTISNGQAGTSGQQGMGSGIFATTISADGEQCPQGNGGVEYTTFIDYNDTGVYADNDQITSVNYICNGATGATGTTGATGASGTNGSSSSVSLVAATSSDCANGGWDITVTNGGVSSQAYPLCNGATGATGTTGATGAAAPTYGLSLVQFIAPCGFASSAYKEQLMLFSDGSLLADFSGSSSADEVRLSFIPDGTYIDTDDSGCVFSISTSDTTRSLTWNSGSSSDDPTGWSAGGWSWSTPVSSSGAVAIQ
jgi:hypothetical protein